MHEQQNGSYLIQNCAFTDALLEMAPDEANPDGRTVQWWNKRKGDNTNQLWLLRRCTDSGQLTGKSEALGDTVETVAPLNETKEREMRIVWMDPTPARAVGVKGLRLQDIARFEFPGSGKEIPWSNGLSRGGLDTFAIPRLDLLYRVYRESKGSAPATCPRGAD